MESIKEGTQSGTIKFYSHKGFGFIRPNDDSSDVFFHVTELPTEYQEQRTIQEGTYVQYELGTRNGKPVARSIVVVGGDE